MKYRQPIIVLFIMVLSFTAIGQNSTFQPKNWEIVLNTSYNNYNIVFKRPSVNYLFQISSIPQFDIGFRRNISIRERITLGIGFSYRYIPFAIKYGYSSEAAPNLLDPNDYK